MQQHLVKWTRCSKHYWFELISTTHFFILKSQELWPVKNCNLFFGNSCHVKFLFTEIEKPASLLSLSLFFIPLPSIGSSEAADITSHSTTWDGADKSQREHKTVRTTYETALKSNGHGHGNRSLWLLLLHLVMKEATTLHWFPVGSQYSANLYIMNCKLRFTILAYCFWPDYKRQHWPGWMHMWKNTRRVTLSYIPWIRRQTRGSKRSLS